MYHGLKYNPLKIVLEKAPGSAILSLLSTLELLHTELAMETLSALSAKQNNDGGFPNQFDRKCSGLKATYSAATALLECGTKAESTIIKRAVRFVLNLQQPEGGFVEVVGVPIPEGMSWESKTRPITYYASHVCRFLSLAKQADGLSFQKAVSWLKNMQLEDGSFPIVQGGAPDPDSTADIAFTVRDICGEDDDTYIRAKERFEDYLNTLAEDVERGYYLYEGNNQELDIYYLTQFLSKPIINAGYDLNDRRVAKTVEAIISTQRPDGGWRVFWGEESDPFYSCRTLEMLLLINAIPKSAFREDFIRYCD